MRTHAKLFQVPTGSSEPLSQTVHSLSPWDVTSSDARCELIFFGGGVSQKAEILKVPTGAAEPESIMTQGKSHEYEIFKVPTGALEPKSIFTHGGFTQ